MRGGEGAVAVARRVEIGAVVAVVEEQHAAAAEFGGEGGDHLGAGGGDFGDLAVGGLDVGERSEQRRVGLARMIAEAGFGGPGDPEFQPAAAVPESVDGEGVEQFVRADQVG